MNTEEFVKLKEGWQQGEMAITRRKQHDYSSGTQEDGDAFSNFEFAGYIGEFFRSRSASASVICAAMLIGVKLARIAELQTKTNKNESEDDSFDDLANYVHLMRGMRVEERELTEQFMGDTRKPQGGDWTEHDTARFPTLAEFLRYLESQEGIHIIDL